jgi:hypothetical protein
MTRRATHLALTTRLLALSCLGLLAGNLASAQTSVLTFHNDNQRTGLNAAETVLDPDLLNGKVTNKSFGSLGTVTLDEQVDAQPLVWASKTAVTFPNGKSAAEVAYVVTENNTVYAIDASRSSYDNTAILNSKNLGTAVPLSKCNNNSSVVGINSTPVIDPDGQTIYVVSYQVQGTGQAYYLYALGLDLTVKDSIQIKGSAGKVSFQPALQRQRAALLYSAHSQLITVGFASFCDQQAAGWVFALPRLGTNGKFPTSGDDTYLIDQKFPTATLSSVWMSGDGIAEGPLPDSKGVHALYFLTGNTTTGQYDPNLNPANSLVKLSAALAPEGHFTPANETTLDQNDWDFAAGGIVLADPTFRYARREGTTGRRILTSVSFLQAYGAGKDGTLYSIDRESLKASANPPTIGSCHCAPSAFPGADGDIRIVTSSAKNDGDNTTTVREFKVEPVLNSTGVPVDTKLALLASWSMPGQVQNDGGGFTAVSTNQNANGSGIIWALRRAVPNATPNQDAVITLYALMPGSLAQLGPSAGWTAGQWPANSGANANLVPTVANAHVFVGSYKLLQVFGVLSH